MRVCRPIQAWRPPRSCGSSMSSCSYVLLIKKLLLYLQAYSGLETAQKLRQQYVFLPAKLKEVYLTYLLEHMQDHQVRRRSILSLTSPTWLPTADFKVYDGVKRMTMRVSACTVKVLLHFLERMLSHHKVCCSSHYLRGVQFDISDLHDLPRGAQ